MNATKAGQLCFFASEQIGWRWSVKCLAKSEDIIRNIGASCPNVEWCGTGLAFEMERDTTTIGVMMLHEPQEATGGRCTRP